MKIENIKKHIQNLILRIMSVLMVLTLIPYLHVRAESTTITCTDVPGRQIYYVDGIAYDTPESHFLRADGIPAYCIQPKIPEIYHPIGYVGEDPGWTKMSELDQNIMLAYAFFGYGFDGERTNERYLAAQDLIWEYLGTTNITRATIDTTQKKNEIRSLVEQLRFMPNLQVKEYNQNVKEGSFFTGEIDGNVPVHVVNTNGSLDNFNVVVENGTLVDVNGEPVSTVVGNDFYVKVAMGQQAKIRFINKLLSRNDEGGENQIIYRSSINQDVIKAGKLHVDSAEINLHAVGTSISLIKRDIDTNLQQPQGAAESFVGTSYELFDETTQTPVGMLNIDASGISNTIHGLYYSHQYSVKEITAPTGYKLDMEKKIVLFNQLPSYTNHIALDVFDDVITGKFCIHKLFVDKHQSALATNEQGATFTAILQKHIDRFGSFEEAIQHLSEFTPKEYAVITTDEEGIAKSWELAYGKYTVRQTGAKDSEIELLKEDFVFEVSRENQPDIKYEISNISKEYYLRLVKKDSETNEIIDFHSAGFKIKDSNGDYVVQRIGEHSYDTFQTSTKEEIKYPKGTFCVVQEGGTITTPLKLSPGSYTIEEISSPEGFTRELQEIPFTLQQENVVKVDEDNNQYITVEVKNNRIYGELELQKKVEEYQSDRNLVTEKSLAGIVFRLIADEDIIEPMHGTVILPKGHVFTEFITDENGYASVEKIPLGKYVVQEIKTLDGLVLDETTYPVQFVEEDDITATVHRNLTITNQITKTEITKTMITGSPEIPGAKLRILDEENTIVDEWVSAYQVAHKIAGLTSGKKYTLHEEMTADGYYYADDITFTVNPDGTVLAVEMIDKPVEYLIEKIDEDGKAVSGVRLQLKNISTGELVPLPNDGVTTSEAIHLNNLHAGEQYELEEVEIVNGVHRASTMQFTVPKYNPTTTEPIKIQMVDLTVDISLKKVDEDGRLVVGAILEIYEAVLNENQEYVPALDENQNPKMVHRLVTTEEEVYDIGKHVKGGSTYILHEVEAPFGYERMDQDIVFTATGTKDKPQLIQAVDRKKKIYVRVKKVDAEDYETVLENTEFTVFHSDGTIAMDIYGRSTVGITDKNGYVDFAVPYAVSGMYVMETEAPKGYEISAEKYEIKHLSAQNFSPEKPVEMTVADEKEKDIPTGVGIHYGVWFCVIGGLIGIAWTIFSTKRMHK